MAKIDPITWHMPVSRNLIFAAAEVHVWRVAVCRGEAVIPLLDPLLAAEERKRGKAFRREPDQKRYLLGRGLLRMLLGRYLHRPAADLRFTYNEYGKPALAPLPGEEGFEFNVSHSGDWILVGMAQGRAVGVDVEQVRPLEAWEQVAATIFTPGEIAALRALPVGEREVAFFQTWVRKEAALKALGKGLGGASADAGKQAALSLHDLEMGRDYAAAVAAVGEPARLCCWEWEGKI